MTYADLSDDAKETVKEMVYYCVNHGCCMGMEEGIDLDTGEKMSVRKELEAFAGYTDLLNDGE